ncbi:siderophore biosynthesis protein [Microtetraspora sp. NBRC 16547]|uniref:ATP-grasp domain-containing protein n=1 Tax=Microtetraspora sp. NBRC 16547 TaxID=3030993 RepID=UPI0024A45B60|nr:siderophore biosynthesis protein [Microtetraspora sp. NBRC 16547]GLW97787.1 carboxylate--amine ligase [Microtetraspora sp. NBRC 16547]
MRLYLTSLNPTDSVTEGFLPAAEALGWDITILTGHPGGYPGFETIETDVRDVRALIDTIARHHPPGAVFSNSDHIQAETALAAAYFGLPGKDWRACLTAKNKALTRRWLTPVESVRSVRLVPGAGLPDAVPYPVVVKPAMGVASEDVVLARDAGELDDAVAGIRARRPGEILVAEEYLDGPLHTLETLGDGVTTAVLGGFRTTLGPLPHFVEERLDWDPEPPPGACEHVLAALAALGVGFGACHTEYVVTPDGPRIIEVNYRVIGDNCDLLLADLTGVPLFEWILRVHAGEPLPTWREAPAAGHGAVVSLVADRSGVVTSAPPAGEGRWMGPWEGPREDPREDPWNSTGEHGGVRLWHRPLRRVGDRIELTGTNRDYLGLLRAVGPDRAGVDAAVTAFRDDRPWVIA